MGGCHSCDEKAAETSRECKATLKQVGEGSVAGNRMVGRVGLRWGWIRERLALIFDRMDTHKEGSVTVEMAIKFLKLSRRDLSAGVRERKEINNSHRVGNKRDRERGRERERERGEGWRDRKGGEGRREKREKEREREREEKRGDKRD
eukprot:1356969-Amorphochlora_amoeboformis.AAC.1